ncbi:MAG: hypothetical protein K2J47_06800 [Ruminococcus sp.]|nr:hypothetical protein [Ruminococcus sp.]
MNEYKSAKMIIDFARKCVNRLSRQQLLRLIDRIDSRIDEIYNKEH